VYFNNFPQNFKTNGFSGGLGAFQAAFPQKIPGFGCLSSTIFIAFQLSYPLFFPLIDTEVR
jgi:hypothetical protein